MVSVPARSAGSGRVCLTSLRDDAYTGLAPDACAQHMYIAAAVWSSSALVGADSDPRGV